MAQAIITQDGERYVSVGALDALIDNLKHAAIIGNLVGVVSDEQAQAVGATLDTLTDGIVAIAVEQHLTGTSSVL